MQCTGVIIYLYYVKPFENPLLNRMEIFNEISIILIAYHLFMLTDF